MNSNNDNDFKLSIPKMELTKLPAATYSGRIVVVDKEEDVAAAVKVLRSSDIIGFDTETKPSFKRGATNKVSLLQLSTREICYLFRINHVSLNGELRKLLEDKDVLKVGLSIHDDFHNLQKLTHLSPAGFIDLQTFATDYHIIDKSLSRIYAIVFGMRISKGQRLSNWEATTLTPAQQMYAALDAKACIDIYTCLSNGMFHPENSPYRVVEEPLIDSAEDSIE